MAAQGVVAHRLGPVTQVPPGEGREFLVDGRAVAVFRLRDGALRAVDGRCPHREGPLADGLVGMDSVVCPLHARRFSLVSGDSDAGDCAVAVHRVRLADGQIVVELP